MLKSKLPVLDLFCGVLAGVASAQGPIVLHSARLLDVETGRIVAPGEVLVRGERIAEVAGAGI